MSTVNGTVIFQDDFATNGRLSSANWDYVHFSVENNASFLGLTQLRQELPLAEKGVARIRLDTFLLEQDGSGGKAFSGSDATTTQAWLPDSSGGVAFEGQFRFTQPQGGMVAGFFTYEEFPPPEVPFDRNLHDEIDYEIFTTNLNRINTNPYAHDPQGPGTPQQFAVPGGVALWHTYRIEWLPDAVLWYVDGELLRSYTKPLTNPQEFHINLWGVPREWTSNALVDASIGDPNFKPAASAAENRIFYFDVASLKVERLESQHGDAAANTLIGAAGNDGLDGGAGNDVLAGKAGNDTLIGAQGNDLLDGGAGIDTAIFSGTRANYGVSAASGVTTITDNRTGPTFDGTDTLSGVEFVSFSDGRYAVAAVGVLTPAPFTGSVGVATLNELVVYGDAYTTTKGHALAMAASAGVLANDSSGSALRASLVSGPAQGTLGLAADGSFTYTPTTGSSGIDSFVYRTTDATGAFGEATAIINVAPLKTGATPTVDLANLPTDQQIAGLYVGFFGRGADADGFRYWIDAFDTGSAAKGAAAALSNVAIGLGASDEARTHFPVLANPATASDAQIGSFIDGVYHNLFNRNSDAAGKTYWTGQVKQAASSADRPVGAVVAGILGGAEAADITTILNKVAVELEYIKQQELYRLAWNEDHDGAARAALITNVTADPVTVLVGIKQAFELVLADSIA